MKNAFIVEQVSEVPELAGNPEQLSVIHGNYDGTEWLEQFSKRFPGRFENHWYVPDHQFGNGRIHSGKIFPEVSYLLINCSFNKDISFSFNRSDTHKGVLLFNFANAEPAEEETSRNTNGYMRFLQGMYFADSFGMRSLNFQSHAEVRLMAVFFECNWLREHFSARSTEKLHIEALCTSRRGTFIHQALTYDQRTSLQELFERDNMLDFSLLTEHSRVVNLLETGLKKIVQTSSELSEGKLNSKDKEVLLKIEKLLLRTFSEPPPTIKELARIACMSETSFKLKFKRMFGMNVSEYFQHFRLTRAKELLETDTYTVREVGFKIGYTNMSHFSRNFRNKFGVLPSNI